jgi:tRNA(Ile)-lysidine synthase
VRSFIKAHGIFEPGPVVVACSGGPDSVALVGILRSLADEFGLVLHVAHFDHRMRPDSARDVRVVQRLAMRLGLPSHIGSAARAPRGESDARDARYRFLRAIAAQIGAHAIALGHTRDDQAETVLLHLVRGTGVTGLAAMRPRRQDLARPLLCLSRAETAAYAPTTGVRPVADPTNRDPAYARNLIRLRVLPLLERINPRAKDALTRVADAAAVLADALRGQATEALAQVRVAESPTVLDLDRLPVQEALRSETLALAAEQAGTGVLSERHRDALLALAAVRDGSARLDLPNGYLALREYARLRIAPAGTSPSPPAPLALAPGQRARWGEWSFLVMEPHARDEPRDLPLRARIPAADGLLVRAWRPGDRLAGGKKVQDVLTDAKVPRRLRASYPVIVTQTGDIVWVPGLAIAKRAQGAETEVRLAARSPAGAEA